MSTRTSSLSSLPRLAVIATGGTIAGLAGDPTSTLCYQAGVLSIDQLLQSTPGLTDLALIEAEQLASIDSKDMAIDIWVRLADRINVLLARSDIDGVVVTHGTDTLEETAYFLHLTVKSHKPVVLTAAMRPANAQCADGPMNFYQAVAVASNPRAAGQGVLIVLHDQIYSARDISKYHTTALDAFDAPAGGALGWVQDAHSRFEHSVTRPHTIDTPFSLAAGAGSTQPGTAANWPTVEIVTSYAGVSDIAINALIEHGVRGIVVAGTGNGSIHSTLQQVLADAAQKGVIVVRASRIGCGPVLRNAHDAESGWIAAGTLNPYKARILLLLALAHGFSDPDVLQDCFDTY